MFYTGSPRCSNCGAPPPGLSSTILAHARHILARRPRGQICPEAVDPQPDHAPQPMHLPAGGDHVAVEGERPVETGRSDIGSLRLSRQGGIKLDRGVLLGIAETFSRLHHAGWSEEEIAISFEGGTCLFLVSGRIGGRLIRAEGMTLIGALQQAWVLAGIA
jgi:hypothetical protein